MMSIRNPKTTYLLPTSAYLPPVWVCKPLRAMPDAWRHGNCNNEIVYFVVSPTKEELAVAKESARGNLGLPLTATDAECVAAEACGADASSAYTYMSAHLLNKRTVAFPEIRSLICGCKPILACVADYQCQAVH